MQRGPRLYNALSNEERLARLRRKAARKEKEVHRVRKNRIIACFAIAFLIFGLQLIMVHVQTGRINNQIQANKTELNQVNKTNKKLKAQVADLKDPDYVAKVIRYKFYYSKSGESIYTLPEKEEDY